MLRKIRMEINVTPEISFQFVFLSVQRAAWEMVLL